ncbi:MAG: ABC transporter permease [Gemmataceae bacterium]
MLPTRFAHAFKLGLRSLAAHRLRSGLTTLGIVLGVGSVIVMLAVGEAARYQALKQLEDLGANTILLRSVKPTEEVSEKKGTDLLAYGLTYADLNRLKTTIPTVTAATPVREFRKTVRVKEKKLETRVVSVTPDFLRQTNIPVVRGRGIEPPDEERFANVAVIGAEAADKLFPAEDPVGKTVGVENLGELLTFTVVGVTAPKTLATGTDGGNADYTKVLFIPFATDRVRIGREVITLKANGYEIERLDISQVTLTVDDLANVPRTAAAVQSLIDHFHPNKDVQVVVPLDLLKKAEETQRLFTLILGAIAGISLVVGGIGIMNIMLATVTERTREIGVRRALGAKRKDIALQFLVETLTLSCFGGVIGIGVGIGLAYLVSWGFGLPAIVRTWSTLLAFGVSALVGLASGLYPARRAARLDPVEALRQA